MPSWFAPVLVVFLGVFVLAVARDLLRIQRLRSALRADRMDLVLCRPRPMWLGTDLGTYCHAVAAFLTGDAPRAEQLLDEMRDRPAAQPLIDPADITYLRAELLLEAGDHVQVTRLLGDGPDDVRFRRVRAGSAIERGDYDLAHDLLQPRGESGYDEAMRLRVAGLLAGRRGSWVDSSSHLNEALALLAGVSARPGVDVDRAWTHHFLAEGALLADDLQVAVTEAERATTLMDRHGRHPQGIMMSYSLAARAHAQVGDLDAARRHLEVARDVAGRLHGEVFRAELLTTEAEVAWAEGRSDEAQVSLTAARAIRDALGEVPARDRADAQLAEWTATGRD